MSFLRGAVLGSIASVLVFFCSCERHRADELPPESAGKTEIAPALSPSPHVSPTPADFFPSATPR